jgi:hypothetical protein
MACFCLIARGLFFYLQYCSLDSIANRNPVNPDRNNPVHVPGLRKNNGQLLFPVSLYSGGADEY